MESDCATRPYRRGQVTIVPKDHQRLQVSTEGKIAVLDMGTVEIWDGADLVLLRDTLVEIRSDNRHPKIGINMQHVKSLPSGFFGMLLAWSDKNGPGSVFIISPGESVRGMLWFRLFFDAVAPDRYVLRKEPKSRLIHSLEVVQSNEVAAAQSSGLDYANAGC